MSLGKNLSKLMKERGYSLIRLAKASGVSKQTIHGWMTGRRVQDLGKLKKVALVLESPIHELIYGEPDPFTTQSHVILKELFSGDVRVTIHKLERRN